MKFTTHFALQAQEARLFEYALIRGELHATDGILTLYDALFQGTYAQATLWKNTSLGYNAQNPYGSELTKLSCSRFTRRY